MTQLVTARKLQPFELPIPAQRPTAPKKTDMGRRDLIIVLAFCAIGLILTCAALAQPDFFIRAAGIP